MKRKLEEAYPHLAQQIRSLRASGNRDELHNTYKKYPE
jgi:hypothetical protein